MTGKTATFVRSLNDRQTVWRLSTPVTFDFPEKTTNMVVASLAKGWTGEGGCPSPTDGFVRGLVGGNPCECLVFPAGPDGEIVRYLEVGGSYHCPGGARQALEEMGFRVEGLDAEEVRP